MGSAIKALWHRWAWKKTDCEHSLLILSRSSRPLIEMSAFYCCCVFFYGCSGHLQDNVFIEDKPTKTPSSAILLFPSPFCMLYRDCPVEMTGSIQHKFPHRPICPFASSLWAMVSKINQTDCGTLTRTDTSEPVLPPRKMRWPNCLTAPVKLGMFVDFVRNRNAIKTH